MFRRGYQLYAKGSASGDEFLTRYLKGSAQCFAGASWDLLARMWRAVMLERGWFFFKIVGLRKNKGVTL